MTREDCLRDILALAFEAIQKLASSGVPEAQQRQQYMLLSLALELVENILCFDFLGVQN